MPELLKDGLPERRTRAKYDFSQWSDGNAWKFVKGDDYESSTDTFRANVKRWAKDNGFDAEVRPYPALDRDGREVPVTKTDPIGLGVKFTPASASPSKARS